MKAQHVMNAVKEAVGGVYANLLLQRFEKACKRHGLNERKYRLDKTLFNLPPPAGDQLGLFG